MESLEARHLDLVDFQKRVGRFLDDITISSIRLPGSGGPSVVFDNSAKQQFNPNVEEKAKEEFKEANVAVRNNDLKKYLCPILKSFSGDVFEIAKVTTPILVSLSLAGTISLPLNPVIFGAIAVVISRMGVAALCAEDKPKP